MNADIELGQPHNVDIRSLARQLREWLLTASRRRGHARGNNAQRSVSAGEMTDRQPGTMIRPSTHEKAVLACRNGDWP